MRASTAIWILSTLLLTAGCTRTGRVDRGGMDMVDPSRVAASTYHEEVRFAAFERRMESASGAAQDCAEEVATPRMIILFQGLVDLASEEPGAEGMVSQEELRVALVDATDPDELPVLDHRVAKHRPWLYFPTRLNPDLGDAISDVLSRVSLVETDIEIVESTLGADVLMHREARMDRVPSSEDTCSLHWLVQLDSLIGRRLFRPGVFSSAASEQVTSLITIGEGEAYTNDFFVDENDEPCRVDFSDFAGYPRSVARTFAVAVPLSEERKLILARSVDGSEVSWEFTLPDGQDEAVLTVANHPVDAVGEDFAAHYALRQGMDLPDTTIPLPQSEWCDAGPPHNNAQCSPADNQVP